MNVERVVFSLSQLFLKRITQEIDKMDEAGIVVNKELLTAFNILLKNEMQKYPHLPKELVDKAIDVAFAEILKQRSVRH